MKLIGFPTAGRASIWDGLTRYQFIASGLRIGLPRVAHSDITGNLGTEHGRGRRVRDELGEFTLATSPGRSASVLRRKVGKFKRGPRKGQDKFVILSRKGAGRGRILGRRARAVGVGCDPAQSRALSLDAWLQPLMPCSDKLDVDRATVRARIVSEVAQAGELGAKLQAIGARAAARQGRRLRELRGVAPSATLLSDAASDAVAGVLDHVRRLDKLTAAHWSSARCIYVLGMYAGRAAFRSLASWSVCGITGDNSQGASSWRELVADAFDAVSGETSGARRVGADDGGHVPTFGLAFRDGAVFTYESNGREQPDKLVHGCLAGVSSPIDGAGARWQAVRWIYHVGLREFIRDLPGDMRGAARAQAIVGARRRCRVVASVIMGAPLIESCARAGFDSVASWQQSCKGAGLFPALRAARAARSNATGRAAYARGMMREYALQAATLAKVRRGGGFLWDDITAATVPAFRSVPSGSAAVIDSPHVSSLASHLCGLSVLRRPAGRKRFAQGVRGVGEYSATMAARAVVASYADAVRRARFWRDVARRAHADNLRAFDKILAGIHGQSFGDLRRAFGLADKRGRARSVRKLDGSTITRARGKVSAPRRAVRTVPLSIITKRGARKLPCAVSAGPVIDRRMDGAGGFVMLARPAVATV